MSTETLTFAACAVVLLAALPTAVWLKRVGAQEWRRHQRRMVHVHLVVDTAKFTAALSAIGPAMGRMVAEAAKFEDAMTKLRKTIEGDRQ